MIFSSLLLFVVLAACDTTPEGRMQERLDRFLQLLPETQRQEFEQAAFDELVIAIDSLVAEDSVFTEKWKALKKSEGIVLFTTTDVVNYYAENFKNKQTSD